MILSLTLAVLAAATTLVLLLPLLRRRVEAPARLAHELAIYRDQLAELERDVGAGRVAASEAGAARLEIERRILSAAASAEPAPAAATASLQWLTVAIAIAVPAAGLLLYLSLGRPELPAQPFASRPPVASDPAIAEAERAIAELRQRIAQKPDDLAFYLQLGQLLVMRDRPAEAVPVLREAVKRGGSDPEPLTLLAEALTLDAEGIVTPEAQSLFRQALTIAPGDPRARFYLGRMEEQGGNARGALERWLALEKDAPLDAPWRATVTTEIDRLARSSGIDPLSIDPKRAAGAMPRPSREDIERMGKLSPEEQRAAIRSMVDGLEAKLKDAPDNLQGWLMLANARKQLGEFDKTAAALQQADRLKPDDPTILADLAEAMVHGAEPGKPPSPELVAVLLRLEKQRPDNGIALFYLAEAAIAAGDRPQAIARYKRLLALIPAQAPVRAQIEQRLKTIEAGP